MSTELQEEGVMTEARAEVYNRQVAEMISIFFKEIALISADDIYDMASQGEEAKSEILLNAVNQVYVKFIANGEGLPKVFFDSYQRSVDSIVHTFKFNITNQLEINAEKVIARTIGKDTQDISYTDIVQYLVDVEETPVEETPVEETPVEETPVEETPVEEVN